MNCPSTFRLEALLWGLATEAEAAHTQTCSTCAQRIEAMRTKDVEFKQSIAPATLPLLDQRLRPKLWAWWAAVAAVPAAMVMVVVLHAPVTTQAKGSFALRTYVQSGTSARLVSDGEQIPGSSALRFRAQTAFPCELLIVSVDAEHQLSRLYPARGTIRLTPGTFELTGGSELDGKAGVERVFGLCAPSPLDWTTLESTVQRQLAGAQGAEAVRALRTLELPGVAQDSLLLEKTP